MIHSAGSDCRLILKFWDVRTDIRTDGQTDGRTDTLCENNDHYRPGLCSASWINSLKLYIENIGIFCAKILERKP